MIRSTPTLAGLLALGCSVLVVSCGDSGLGRVTGGTAPGAPAPMVPVSPPSPPPGSVAGKCSNATPGKKQALFGDMHIHTRLSFDSYFFSATNTPREAYRFGKGEAVMLAGGDTDPYTPARSMQLAQPLDFAAATDHAELIGGFERLCTLQGNFPEGLNPACIVLGQYIRTNIRNFVTGDTPLPVVVAQSITGQVPTTATWQRIQSIAEAENQPCTFTTLNGFEFSSNKNGQVLHRNVIFANDTVPMDVHASTALIPTSDNTDDEWGLFDYLASNCTGDCDAVTIPHNTNQSDGRFARPRDAVTGLPPARGGAPLTRADAELRARYDRLFELTQHKGTSECALGLNPGFLGGEENGCEFENFKSVCTGGPGDPADCRRWCTGSPNDPMFCQVNSPSTRAETCESSATAGSAPDDCTAPLDFLRNVLSDGQVIQRKLGVNPYRYGVVGASDTHNGVAGAVDPKNIVGTAGIFQGHGGLLDDEPKDQMGYWICGNPLSEATGFGAACDANDPGALNREYYESAINFNPGGLAGVWAEENTRPAIFGALKRREAFATSGPRIRIRMFASAEAFPADMCERLLRGESPVDEGRVAGVPMGQTLLGARAAHVVVWAMQDPGGIATGTPLQRLEVVKAWADENDVLRQSLSRVAGSADGPKVDGSCKAPASTQPAQLCGVFTDPAFDPTRAASYYARAIENESCRWSTQLCVSKQVDCAALNPANGVFPPASGFAGFEGCCQMSGAPGSFAGANRFITVQQRAWGSPVWFEPTAP